MSEETDDSWENKMKHMAENCTKSEWKRQEGVSNGGCHYLGATKLTESLGKAFAGANFDLHKSGRAK